MDLNHTVLDPFGAITLHSTLEDGPPVPVSVLADVQTREEHEDVVITTTDAIVRLRTSGSDVSNNEAETSVIIPIAERPVETPYPGLNLDPK